MSLFRKKQRAARIERPFITELKAAIESRQRKAANYLSRKTAYWNRSSKLLALTLFCLLFGGISLWLLLQAIHSF